MTRNEKFPAYYIGYGTLEEWRTHAANNYPVYASLSRETRSGAMMPPTVTLTAVVQQINPIDGNVHYWKMRLASFTEWGEGIPAEEDHRREARGKAGWELILQWLLEEGLVVVEAQVATPKDLRHFEGAADFLHYSKERGWYVDEQEAQHDSPIA